MTATIMFQGTGSDVGKSVLVAGFCRALVRRGFTVRPFKPQNMSNNAAVTACGGEIGRAQALQARACGVEPTVHMNPVLLKPESERGAQIIVQGKVEGQGDSQYFRRNKADLLARVIDSFEALKREADIVVVEGAGSPAEVNLRSGDIANMGFAAATQTPVILIGDIDRGGVIAAIAGTHRLLPADEQELIKGYIINKFRGDVSLFEDALVTMTEMTGWPSMGVLPWVKEVRQLPAEDAVVLDGTAVPEKQHVLVAVLMLSRISNFDDLDPLAQEEGVEVRFIPPGQPLPADSDLVIIPGTKSTLADLAFVRDQGWDIDLAAHIRRGGKVQGICGGYQLLGQSISDPEGIEGQAGRVKGLAHLDVDTVMQAGKTVTLTRAHSPLLGCATSGYEIHIGQTTGPDTEHPFLQSEGRAIGAVSACGRIMGCYLHGLFVDDDFRHAFLAQFRTGQFERKSYDSLVESSLDALADAMEEHLDIEALMRIAGLVKESDQ